MLSQIELKSTKKEPEVKSFLKSIADDERLEISRRISKEVLRIKDIQHSLRKLKKMEVTQHKIVEEAKEQYRHEIFVEHTQIIEDGLKLSEFELCKRIFELEPLYAKQRYHVPSYKDFPHSNGKNLFHVVLLHETLDNGTKLILTQHLLDVGYKRYRNELLKAPFIDILLQSKFKRLIESLYVHNYTVKIPLEYEKKIWDIWINDHHKGISLLSELILKRENPEKLLHYIYYWFNTINDSQIIIDIFSDIEKVLAHYSKYKIGSYKAEIKKLAQIRILTIQQNSNEPFEEDKEAMAFLKSTQPLFYGLFKRHPSSYEIYNMICSKSKEAKQSYLDKIIRAEDRINQKLSQNSEVPGQFSMKTP